MSSNPTSRYKNIAISGSVAVGSSTLMQQLKPRLVPMGFQFQSTGKILRAIMKEKGIDDEKNPVAETLSPDENSSVEDRMHDLLASGDKYVIEAWLAGFVARDIDHTLRVLVKLDNMDVRAQRFAEREGGSIEEAKQYIQDREARNVAFWKKIYGDHDFWDPAHFHLVIDTENTNKVEARNLVLEAFLHSKSSNHSHTSKK